MTDTIEEVLNGTCTFFGIKNSEICSHCTSDELSMARYFCWYYLHCIKKKTIVSIANRFDRRHDTIYKGIAKAKNMFAIKPYAFTYQEFLKHITKQEREQ